MNTFDPKDIPTAHRQLLELLVKVKDAAYLAGQDVGYDDGYREGYLDGFDGGLAEETPK
jgi:hypothetical protein